MTTSLSDSPELASSETLTHQLPRSGGTKTVIARMPVQVKDTTPPPPPPPPVNVAPLIEAVRQHFGRLQQDFDKHLQGLEEECVELVFQAVERITRQEVDRSNYSLADPLKEVLEAHRHRFRTQTIQIRVHPEDESALRGAWDATESTTDLDLQPDPSVPRAGLVLQTGVTEISRSLEDELRQMKESFSNVGAAS